MRNMSVEYHNIFTTRNLRNRDGIPSLIENKYENIDENFPSLFHRSLKIRDQNVPFLFLETEFSFRL